MPSVSLSEFAKQIGVRPSYVTKLKHAGRLGDGDDGDELDTAECVIRPGRGDRGERARRAGVLGAE